MTFRVIVPVLALAIAACSDEPETAAPVEDSGVAEGEVLGGTISDAMLPVDSVQSQSPTMEPRRSSTASSSSNATTSEDAQDTSPSEDANQAPEPTVAAEPVLETAPAATEEDG